MQRQLDSEECCIFASFTQLICIVSIYLFIYTKTSCGYACLFVCKKSVCIWRHYKYIRFRICKDNGKAKNVVYSQVLLSSIHIYKSIYIHSWYTGTQLQWRVTNMVRNDLHARGDLGGAKRPH